MDDYEKWLITQHSTEYSLNFLSVRFCIRKIDDEDDGDGNDNDDDGDDNADGDGDDGYDGS